MEFSRRTLAAATTALVLLASAAPVLALSPIKPYALPTTGSPYLTQALWSVGERVPETSHPARRYQMVGIPDGLGAYRVNGRGRAEDRVVVYLNHELDSAVTSEPVIGQPLNRGAFVTRAILDGQGNVLSAKRAYDTVYNENTLVGPAAEVGNATRAFARFCSGSLAGPAHGFNRFIYLTNEEEGTPADTFDGMGGVAVAIFDNELHTLPRLGHAAWENILVRPGKGGRETVVIGTEDGPAALNPAAENSQLYMYVGTKDRQAATVLGQNGLDNGELYVLAPVAGAGDEAAFQNGSIAVRWVHIPNAGTLDEAALEAASDAANAFRFARPEDGAFNLNNPDEFLFVTTGGAAGANELGRLYSLRLGKKPLDNGTLEVLYNADQVIAAGGDIAISPDNLDVSRTHLMVQEDGTTESRLVMGAKGRDGSIWQFDLDKKGVDVASATRVVTLNPPGRDGIAVGPGIWETSGIIDGSAIFGPDTWLFDVQAHGPTVAPTPDTVEDGQLLVLFPNPLGRR